MKDIILQNLPQQFYDLFGAIEGIEHLEIKRNYNRVLLSEQEERREELEGTQEFIPFQMPEHFEHCLPIQNKVELAWQCQGLSDTLEEEAAGEFYLEEFMSVIFRPAPSIINDFMSEEIKNVIAQSKIIDDQKYNGNGRMTLMRFVDNEKGIYELWYYRKGELFKLNLDYPGYLARLCETKGYYDWQLFFCDPEDLKKSKNLSYEDNILNTLKSIAEALPLVFPDTDNKEYLEICKTFKK